MINKFCKKPLWECSIRLSKVATGAECADLVIKNARLVNVCTHEIIDNVSVAIAEGRIALVGDAEHCIGESTKVIDANGKYLAPAFMDGHIHIESSTLRLACASHLPLHKGGSLPPASTPKRFNTLYLAGKACEKEYGHFSSYSFCR